MTTRKLQMSFSGGEVTPEFFGQLTDSKYLSGLAACKNFIVKPHGPVMNRAGFEYVNTAKTPTLKTRVIPFSFSSTQTMVLEFGEKYVRFHTQGATLAAYAAYDNAKTYAVGDVVSYSVFHFRCTAISTGNLPTNPSFWQDLTFNVGTVYNIGDLVSSGGSQLYYCYVSSIGANPASAPSKFSLVPADTFQITTPYLEADLFDLHFVQSSDVLTIVHPNYAPRELRRVSKTTWPLVPIAFTPSLTAPSAPTVTPTGAGSTVYNYVITSVGSTGLEESAPSTLGTGTGNLLVTGNYMTITWGSTGASRYNVYKQSNGLYGYIGQTDGLTFKDDNITANLGKTPPITSNPFAAAGYYPGAVSYFEQRRCFGGSINEPQNLRMTRSGTESNLTYSIPVRDDDAINIRVAARESNTIRHIVPLQNLVLLTESAEWRVTSINSDAITPTSISVKPQSYVGANNVQPLIINNNIIYSAARGGHMREMAYQFQAGGYITGDLSLRAPHLFDGLTINDMAFSKSPFPIVWAVSSDGGLLGFTYVPEQQIGAWHRHKTAHGSFESVCVVSEGSEDAVYCVVNRGGNRYIERMHSRQFSSTADYFFVDSGITYSGVPATTFSGLSHLEGWTVSILGDGAVMNQKVVTGGSVTIEQPCSNVTIGLPIDAFIQTLPAALQVDPAGSMGKMKNINKIWARVQESSGFSAGPDFGASLIQYKPRTFELYGMPPNQQYGEVEFVLKNSWQADGQVVVSQPDPLPLTLVSITMEVAVGG